MAAVLCCVLGAGADATSGAAGEGATQKTPTELHIQYLTCEADEKLQNLVREAWKWGWQGRFVLQTRGSSNSAMLNSMASPLYLMVQCQDC